MSRHASRIFAWASVAAAVTCASVCAPVARAAAPCDGRSDATAALNALLSAGGQVHLPAGVCLISASLQIPSGAVVSGAGIGRTIIKASPTPDYPVIAMGLPGRGVHDVDLSGLTVDGSGTRLFDRPKDAVLAFVGSFRLRIHDLEAFGAGGNGIKVVGHDIEVSDNVVHDNFANGIYAVGDQHVGASTLTTDIRVLRNRVTHNSLAALPPARSWDGIAIDAAASNCLTDSNTVIGNDIIVFESGKYVAASRGNRVIDNTVLDSPENGIDVGGAEQDFQVIGNRIERTRGFGIVVNGPATGGVIRTNTILGTTDAGVLIDNWIMPGAPHDIEVSGNTVDPGPSAGAKPSVLLRHGAWNVRIANNRVGAHGIDTQHAGAGVVVLGNR